MPTSLRTSLGRYWQGRCSMYDPPKDPAKRLQYHRRQTYLHGRSIGMTHAEAAGRVEAVTEIARKLRANIGHRN